jgi:hypothetical protein
MEPVNTADKKTLSHVLAFIPTLTPRQPDPPSLRVIVTPPHAALVSSILTLPRCGGIHLHTPMAAIARSSDHQENKEIATVEYVAAHSSSTTTKHNLPQM